MNDEEMDNFLEDNFYKHWDWNIIPDHMHDGVKRWVEYGIEGGSFLQSILEHKFYDAIMRADFQNQNAIVGWAQFLSWHLPMQCHGSREKCLEWRLKGGLRGIYYRPEGANNGSQLQDS
jgi:hypothetical protein